MQNQTSPRVTIGIINYNGLQDLQGCVSAVEKSSYQNFEILIIDNGSKDGSIEYIQEYVYPLFPSRIRLIQNERNNGSAGACNQICRLAQTEYVMILANDTEPDRDWLREAVTVMNQDAKIGLLQCRLVTEKGLIDSVGDFIDEFGFLAHIVEPGTVPDTNQFQEPFTIFGVKSACILLRKSACETAGGFNPDYFMYLEETDLSWRLNLAGFKVVSAPRSVVLHRWGTTYRTMSHVRHLRYYYGTRNYLITLITNARGSMLAAGLLLQSLGWCLVAVALATKGNRANARLVFSGLFSVIRDFRQVWSKRVRTQGYLRDELSDSLVRKPNVRRYFQIAKKW